MTYHPSYTQIGHFMGRETICNINSNMADGVGYPVRCQVVPWAVK